MVKLTASEFFHPQPMERLFRRVNNVLMVKRGTRDVTPRFKARPKYRPSFIRQWRKYRGDMTLEQLADRIEMTASHLSMLERGERPYTQETLEHIAHALQTDAASLLMRDPTRDDAIWSVWEHASTADRNKIVEIARTITGLKTGTDQR